MRAAKFNRILTLVLAGALRSTTTAAPIDPFAAAIGGLSRVSGILTPPGMSAQHPAVSPDGSQVAFSSGRGDSRAIYLCPITGATPRRLTRGTARDDFPSFFPDGKSLVFQSDQGGPTKLYRVDLESGTETQLTKGEGDDSHPRVSPSGRYVAFDSNQSGNYEIFILDLKKDRPLIRVTAYTGSDFYPTWSPNEGQMAFTSGRSGSFEIWVKPLVRGGRAQQVTRGPGQKAHPHWSTDGWLAYDLDVHGSVKVMALDPAGRGDPWVIGEDLGSEEFPVWIPGGKELLTQVSQGTQVAIRRRLAGGPPAPGSSHESTLSSNSSASETMTGSRESDLPHPGTRRINGETVRDGPAGDVATGSSSTQEVLEVLSYYPRDRGPGSVRPDASISVVFSERLDPVSEPDKAVTITEDGKPFTALVSYNSILKRLDVSPLRKLRVGSRYEVTLQGNLRALSGKILGKPFSYAFTILPSPEEKLASDPNHMADTVTGFAPTQQEPAPGAHGVEPDARIQVVFTRKLDIKSVDKDAIQVFDAQGQSIAGEVFFPEGDQVLLLTPYKPLREGTVHHVYISPRLKSADGESPPRETLRWAFTTTSNEPFAIIQKDPEVITKLRPRITLTFNRSIDMRTVSRGRPVIKVGSQAYPGTLSIGSGSRIAHFEPYQALPMTGVARLYLPIGLKDLAGNSLTNGGDLSFPIQRENPESRLNPELIMEKHLPVAQVQTHDEEADQALMMLRTAGFTKPADKVLAEHFQHKRPDEAVFTQRFGKEKPEEPKGQDAWIYTALEGFRQKGYLGHTFGATVVSPAMSRYQIASMVGRIEKSREFLAPNEQEQLDRLRRELRKELMAQGFATAPAAAPPLPVPAKAPGKRGKLQPAPLVLPSARPKPSRS